MRSILTLTLTLLVAFPLVTRATGVYRLDEGAGSTALDSSGQGNDGTITNASYVSGVRGTALRFDSPSATVLLPQTVFDDFGNTSYGEAWIRPTSYPTIPCIATVFRKRASFNDWELDLLPTGEMRAFQFGRNTVGDLESVSVQGGTIPLDKWTKVAVHYDGATLRLFINDEEVDTDEQELTLEWGLAYQRTDIGNNPTDLGCSYYFTGDIDEVCLAPNEAACSMPAIFSDGFESGDTSAWSQ